MLAAAGFRYWQYEKEKAEQAAGDQFQAAIAAVEAGKLDEANGGLPSSRPTLRAATAFSPR